LCVVMLRVVFQSAVMLSVDMLCVVNLGPIL